MEQLITEWGENIDREHVLEEYPRPQLVRESFFCLNGEWEYAINQKKYTDEYDGVILVPFSPETYLSGVQRIVGDKDILHYRKNFCLPQGFERVAAGETGDRVLLHFGAVDQECVVFLNGQIIGRRSGGYLPFTFDVTDALREGKNELKLRVRDRTEHSPHARGKQRLGSGGVLKSIFYTPSSGIWKTVWMERVPASYIAGIKIKPMLDEKSVLLRLEFAAADGEKQPQERADTFDGKVGAPMIRILYHGMEIYKGAYQCGGLRILIPDEYLHLWSPEHPDLYDVAVTYGEDRIQSYFGMRKIHRQKDKKGIERIFLNNEPYFCHGVLDQGYWPESLMTPPADEALVYDIMKMKQLGFNTIRKHIKIESERFYYHCDRLGMLVWQDMPNGGGDYNQTLVAVLPNGIMGTRRTLRDHYYKLFARQDHRGRRQYYKDLREMAGLLYNYPCIMQWTLFNEGWGQFDAGKATALIASCDTGRLINEACGWFDQGGGDFYSIHNYFGRLRAGAKADRIVVLSEYGGGSCPVEGHMACDRKFGYKGYHNKEELTRGYQKLIETDILPNISKYLCGAIYTQLSDIEEEINGFMTYDRRVDKMDVNFVRAMNEMVLRAAKEM